MIAQAPTSNQGDQNKMNQQSARNLFKIFATIIFIASATLTFAFFYTYLPAIIPAVDLYVAAIAAGFLGLIIFDGGAIAWLKTYLDACENNDQREIALTTSVIDIAGSAVASFAQIILQGTGLVTLGDDTVFLVGVISLFAVAGVLSWNFVAVWRFHKNSDASKASIREANRMAIIRAKEDEEADILDQLIAQKVGELLAGEADAIAVQQAARIAAKRRRIELGKHYDVEQPAGSPLPQPMTSHAPVANENESASTFPSPASKTASNSPSTSGTPLRRFGTEA